MIARDKYFKVGNFINAKIGNKSYYVGGVLNGGMNFLQMGIYGGLEMVIVLQ